MRELRASPRVAPRMLGGGRLTFVRSQAGPLAGDHDVVELRVGAGAVVTVEPVAASVALPGPARTMLELDVAVGDGGRLVLEDAPLVVTEGADVLRTTTLRLGVGAVALVRDLVVLGRAGEGPGRLVSTLRVEGPDGVILHDALRVDPATWADDAYVALAPRHRAVGMVCRVGGGAVDAAHALDGPGALWRASGASAADVDAALAATWAAVRA